MACSVSLYMCLITVLVYDVIPGNVSNNFPLHDCSSKKLDLLALIMHNHRTRTFQGAYVYSFFGSVAKLGKNWTDPLTMFAIVSDSSPVNNHNISVRHLQFLPTFGAIYTIGNALANSPIYTNVQPILEAKVSLVKRLFSEMRGVRTKAIHIAVIFLDGERFSYDDITNIPYIVEQQNTDIKIFVVVLSDQFGDIETYLNDTLVSPYTKYGDPTPAIYISICRNNMDGWFSFEHSESNDYISWYALIDMSPTKRNWLNRKSGCYDDHDTDLSAIETHEELNYLREKLYLYVKDRVNCNNVSVNASQFTAHIVIGLKRDSRSSANRFQWVYNNPDGFRPLVVTNWLRGKPSGGYNSACGVWRFDWNYYNDKNISNSEERFVDGWSDVGCFTNIHAFTLCEITLSRRLDNTNMMQIRPATKESLHRTLAVTQTIQFEDNIVSVSAHLRNLAFRRHLQATGSMFPIFDCGEDRGEHQYISYIYVCDIIYHCNNRLDELYCKVTNKHGVLDCLGLYCCDDTCLPVQFVNDGEIDCQVCEFSSDNNVNDETGVLNVFLQANMTCAFVCDRNTCISSFHLNNGQRDCNGPDGSLDETIGKLTLANSCYNIMGLIVWAPMCVYIKDSYGAVMGCRDLSHLKDCMTFECSEGYIKCPRAYCIPLHYVLNGKADCPLGEDEPLHYVGGCSGNFACWNSTICLHPDLVCDGHPECPNGDDEVDCKSPCRKGFRCVSGTVVVSDYRSIILEDMYVTDSTTRYLDVSGVDLSRVDSLIFKTFISVKFMILSNCKIQDLGNIMSDQNTSLLKLDISYNLIHEFIINENIFKTLTDIRFLNMSYNEQLANVQDLQFKYLETLDLSHTRIPFLHESFLVGLPSLMHLNLSYTPISEFHQTLSPLKNSLRTLDLRAAPFANFYENVLNGLTITHHLYTDQFQMCCPQIRGTKVPYHTCHAPEDVISSCLDLLGVNVQRVLLWVVAVLAVLGNVTVMVFRIIWDRSVIRTGYGLFVTNLSISDFIMGVYLFIIAGADHYYRGMYVLFDQHWREGLLCRFAGFLSTLSIETSTIFCFFITLDRFLVMKFPFGQKKFSKRNRCIAILLSWITGFFLSSIPIVLGFETYSFNSMCLGLQLTNTRISGWGYSFGVFIVFNCWMFIIIVFGQIAIFRAISSNRITMLASGTPSHLPEDVLLAKQLSLVVLSNFLCWFPVGVMGLMSAGELTINKYSYAWITVAVLPINAAVNPVLYTIPTLVTKWEKFRHGNNRPR